MWEKAPEWHIGPRSTEDVLSPGALFQSHTTRKGGRRMINAIAITVSLIIGMLVGGIIGYCIAKDGEGE